MGLLIPLLTTIAGGLTVWFLRGWLQRKGYVKTEPEIIQSERLSSRLAPTGIHL